MNAPSLDVFSLRDSVVDEYKRFATSFTTIHADDLRSQIEAIYAKERYWPEPLIQINPSYKRTTDVAALVSAGLLEPGCADIFRSDARPLSLYKHQEQAIALAAQGESFMVTTGTGSGKSLCFFIPIVSHVLAARRQGSVPRTHAIVVYPMNALANSQIEELGKFVANVHGAPPLRFARYTGQEEADERKRIADDPPDVLLTNFMMLELLMTRQEEVTRWLLGWRDITNAHNERTVIASLIPRVAVGHTTPLMMTAVEAPLVACLDGCLCSFALDYAARQKVGGLHINFFTMKQFPALAPSRFAVRADWDRGGSVGDWILPRVIELSFTAWDLQPFAEDCGELGPPFIWDPARRFQLRCELDAAFFHLYGISRDDADYILDTFPIVRKHDEKAHGEYRTKRVILEIYDALAEASRTGKPYVSPLGPPRRAT